MPRCVWVCVHHDEVVQAEMITIHRVLSKVNSTWSASSCLCLITSNSLYSQRCMGSLQHFFTVRSDRSAGLMGRNHKPVRKISHLARAKRETRPLVGQSQIKCCFKHLKQQKSDMRNPLRLLLSWEECSRRAWITPA